MLLARDMLGRNIRCNDAALRLAFCSESYFVKCFREEFGITPKKWQSSVWQTAKTIKFEGVTDVWFIRALWIKKCGQSVIIAIQKIKGQKRINSQKIYNHVNSDTENKFYFLCNFSTLFSFKFRNFSTRQVERSFENPNQKSQYLVFDFCSGTRYVAVKFWTIFCEKTHILPSIKNGNKSICNM